MTKATLRTAADSNNAIAPQVQAEEAEIITTSDNHALTLRTLTVVEEMRFLKILGEYNASFYSFCSLVARVASIDGKPVPIPNSEREIEALASRIGKPGIAALMSSIKDKAEFDEEKERGAVKN